MLSIWAWIVFNLLIYANASLENDNTKAFIELTELEYEDTCYYTAEAEWSFINSPSNKTLKTWIEKLVAHSNFTKIQKHEVGDISKSNITDPSLRYKYELIEKAGDTLLNNKDFETFAHFAVTADLLKSTVLRSKPSENYARKDVEQLLSRTNNIEEKKKIWTDWHQQLSPLIRNFSSNLLFLQEASKANEANDLTEYWELLTGYEDGYDKLNYEWDRIANLHKKVTEFVLASLSHKYGISINETIPVYLLGSLQGNDWTAISVDVTPYPNLMYNIKKNLWKRKHLGKSLYKTASAMGTTLLNQVPQADFWNESQFSQYCPPKLINFCKDGITKVSTCFEPTVSNFLQAHKDVGKILYNQMSIEATPVLNMVNRYSGLEEGVSELFGILAASPAWLNHTHLLDDSIDNDERVIVSLMITALDLLPRLAYYMSADMWRINAIKTGITNATYLTSSWWKYRQEYEGISCNGTEVPSFLNDEYITKNKPYFPKFVGTILAFQLYEYLMESTEVRYDQIVEKQVNANFIKMIQQGAADDWLKIANKFLEIDDVSANSLISFFSPLEDFLDTVDEDYEFKSVTAPENELRELEKKIIEEMNTPVTTTTIATTTVAKISNPTRSHKRNETKSGLSNTPVSETPLKSESSMHNIQEDQPEPEKSLKSEVSPKVPFDESLLNSLDEEEKTKPKTKSSKAVWAVGSVLVGTIVICIIAIFGRQRCRKTPKNRRYV